MPKKPIKIVCVIHSLSIGGMERVMSILLNDFSNRENVDVSVLLIGRYRTVDFKLDKNIQVYKPEFEFNNKMRLISTIKTIRFIRKTVCNINPDTVLSFGEMWNNLVLLSLKATDIPVYVSDRGQPNKNLGFLHNFLRDILYKKAKGLIAQTNYAAGIANAKHWNKNITVIGNPIRKLNLPNIKRENIILNVGRLIPTKNVDQLIDIFSEVDNDAWKLYIIGGNAIQMNLYDELNQQIIRKNKTESIALIGELRGVKEFYAKSKIFAFTSTSEGFPNALGEAMAAGCACIAYDCKAGPSDMIDDEINGYLIPAGNKKMFLEKLKELLNDEDKIKTFGRRGQEKMESFDAKLITQKYFEFITCGVL